MTFVDEEEIELPTDSLLRNSFIKMEILRKFSNRQLALADFNWSGNFDPENTKSYLHNPYKFNAVVEIKLRLDMNIIGSRDAIYERCRKALQDDEILVRRSQEFQNQSLQKRQSLISFDMVN